MKKIALSLALLGLVGLSAATLDASAAQVGFEGYKLAKKTAVPGTFKDVKFNFTTTEGSVPAILKGATADIDFTKIDTKLPVRNQNIVNKLVKLLTSHDIKVSFDEVTGDDTKGDIKAKVVMNGVSKEVPLSYTVEGGKLVAKGEINQMDFMPKAFEAFKADKVIAGLHQKMTHPEVGISFTAPVK